MLEGSEEETIGVVGGREHLRTDKSEKGGQEDEREGRGKERRGGNLRGSAPRGEDPGKSLV